MIKFINLIQKALIIISLILISGFAQFLIAQEMSLEEQNKLKLNRLINEAYNQRKLDVVDEIADSNYVEHTNNITTESSNVIKQTIIFFEKESPDFKIVTEDMIADGDKVAMYWIYSGMNKKYDKQVIIHGIYIARFSNGKLVEGWQIFDNLSRHKQLGYTLISPSALKEE